MPRPKGSLNRRSAAVLRELKQLLGENFNPVVEMAQLGMETDDPALKLNAMKEVAKYTHPQLKATEVTAEVTDGRSREDAIADLERIFSRGDRRVPQSSDRDELH